MKQLSLALDDAQVETPRSYKGIYAMHKYWSKKPFNLVANYIAKFSEPGDTILDPFCGSGVTVIESVRLRRKAVGFDINPIAVFLTKMGLERVDISSLEESFEAIRSKTMPSINGFYRTSCPNCKSKDAFATHVIWQDNSISELWVKCEACQTAKVSKSPDQCDLDSIRSLDLPDNWYPEKSLHENARINAKICMKVSDLFTNRALHGLALLLSEIQRVENTAVRNALRLCFSASLPQASRMVFVIRRRGKSSGHTVKPRAEVGSWVIGYWIPKEHFEINVWRCFENRFRRIIKGKAEIAEVFPRAAAEYPSLTHLAGTSEGYYVSSGNASCLPVTSESIDYIFTDPPHGNRLPYLELSQMWNSWLGFTDINWDDEVVVSAAKARQKNLRDYRNRLALALQECWRVLKPEKYMSVAFNSLDDKIWLSLLNSCTHAGFKLIMIQPMKYSATSVVQDNRKNALKTDFVLTFQKRLPLIREELILRENIAGVRETIHTYLEVHVGGSAETFDIMNHVMVTQAKRGFYTPIKLVLDVLNRDFHFVDSSWQV